MKLARPSRKKSRPFSVEIGCIKQISYRLSVVDNILMLFNTTVYHVWWERNQRRFGDSNRTLTGIINDVYFEVLNYAKKLKPSAQETHAAGPTLAAWGVDTSSITIPPKTCSWLKPQLGCWALNCDGVMDDNKVGYGGLFCDAVGAPSFAYFGPGTKKHVLWVELQAIYRGITLALLRGWYNLRVNV